MRVRTLALFSKMGNKNGERFAVASRLDTQRRGHVLIVDDEAFIIAALRRLLGTEHEVTAVMSAFDAIALFERGRRFHVILCDLRMPGMSGIDFYEKLGTLAPDMINRIVFFSGATFSSELRQFFDRVPNRLLEKPFDPGAVRSLVRTFVNEGPIDVA